MQNFESVQTKFPFKLLKPMVSYKINKKQPFFTFREVSCLTV